MQGVLWRSLIAGGQAESVFFLFAGEGLDGSGLGKEFVLSFVIAAPHNYISDLIALAIRIGATTVDRMNDC